MLAASRSHRDEIIGRVPRVMRRTFTMREAARIASLLPIGRPQSVNDLIKVVQRMADRRADAAASTPAADDVIDPHRKDFTVVDDMVREEVPALAAIAVPLWAMPPADAAEYARVAADAAQLR